MLEVKTEKLMKKISTYLILLVLLFLLVKGFWGSQFARISDDKTIHSFIISKGESFSLVSKRLSDEKLIKSSFFFTILAKQKNLSDKIQSGTFKLSSSMTSEEILETITGNPSDNWVTLLEGWRVEEMADKLSEEGLGNKEEFIKLAQEGYMFPDTYLIPKDYSTEQIVKVLKDNFEKKYTPELRLKIKSLNLTEDEGMILASIVEREARSQQAREIVASILLKRLNLGMGLNADATLQYIYGYSEEEKSWWTKKHIVENKQSDSPYNSYKFRGLLPAPICNPSLSSLQAVANADLNIPYLYYYHDSKGNSHYAKTLEEHNANIANNP